MGLNHLNDTELDLIDGLVPPGQMLIRKAQTSKKVHLNVDSVSHWMATNNARDNLKKQEYFDRHGFADGLRLCLAITKSGPFLPHDATHKAGQAMLSIQVVKGLVKSWKRFPGLNSRCGRQYAYNLDESAPDNHGSWSEITQAATA